MAVGNILKLCVTQSGDGKNLSIKDNSGIYASNNTGGWGAPNSTIAQALTASLSISKLVDIATNLYSTPIVINVGPTATPPDNILPNITNTPFIITAQAAGYGLDSVFPDGYYQLVYTVTGNSGGAYTITTITYLVLTSQIDCCYKTLSNKVALCSCDCVEIEKQLSQVAFFKRELSAAKSCGNISDIVRYIDFLTKKCGAKSCC